MGGRRWLAVPIAIAVAMSTAPVAHAAATAGAEPAASPPTKTHCPHESVSGDPRGDAGSDVIWFFLTYVCDTGEWLLQYELAPGSPTPATIEAWFDVDRNPRNGCEGFDHLVRVGTSGGTVHRLAHCPAAPPATATVTRGPSTVVRWPATAIGDPRENFSVRAAFHGPAGGSDLVPDVGRLDITGVDRFSSPPPPFIGGPRRYNGRCEIPVWVDEARESLIRLYYAYFRRDALEDPAGLDYWLGRHHSGQLCLTEVSEYFAGSAEFVATYGMLTDPEFVRRVYLNVLGREPDADGYTYWAHQLAAGAVGRGTMMVPFSESPEFRARAGI